MKKRDIFQAIADPTRRTILILLAAHAMTPNALAENFEDVSRQAISKHIKILKECEVINQQKEGREIYYSLKAEKVDEIEQWIAQLKQIWEKRFSQLDQVLKNLTNKNNED